MLNFFKRKKSLEVQVSELLNDKYQNIVCFDIIDEISIHADIAFIERVAFCYKIHIGRVGKGNDCVYMKMIAENVTYQAKVNTLDEAKQQYKEMVKDLKNSFKNA